MAVDKHEAALAIFTFMWGFGIAAAVGNGWLTSATVAAATALFTLGLAEATMPPQQ